MLLLRAVAERDNVYARLDALARTDPLTGLANRRAFLEHAQAFLSAAARSGAPLALLLLDIDRFKAVNDRFGHGAGDAVLRAVAAALRGAIRVGDLPVRWGGEEFAVLLPGTDLPAAVALAERLRAAVRDGVPHPAGGRVTVSIGAARLGPGPPTRPWTQRCGSRTPRSTARRHRGATGSRPRRRLTTQPEGSGRAPRGSA